MARKPKSILTQFKVVAISENTNAFGLRSVVMLSRKNAFQILANALHIASPFAGQRQADRLRVGKLIVAPSDLRNFADFAAQSGWECPAELPRPSQEVFNAVWGDNLNPDGLKHLVFHYNPGLDSRITNLGALRRGSGANFLECILAHDGYTLIAKQWRRREPGKFDVLVKFPEMN